MKYLRVLFVFVLLGCVPAVGDEDNPLVAFYTKVANEHSFGNPVVITGDSLVARMEWNWLLRDNLGYDKPTVFNRGIGGDTTSMLKARFQGNVMNLNPSRIFVLIGTNNFQTDRSQAAVDAAFADIQAIADMAGDTPITFISVLPVLNKPARSAAADKLNALIQANYDYIDVATSIQTEHLIGDNTAHINDAGYVVFGNILAGHL